MTTETLETSPKIIRTFEAPVEKVFQAWTDPAKMVKWMGPGTIYCKDVQIALKVGGQYRIHMFSEEDGDHIAIGEYQEIVPNQKLVFTWSWESGTVTGSLVTIEFESQGESTQITLLHEDFPTKESAERHNQEWNGCLDKLEKFYH